MARHSIHSVSRDESSIRSRSRRVEQESKQSEKELEAIKERYLGASKKRQRVIKPSEKFRFSFDWDHTEDTSQDTKPLYHRPHDARLVFGRGKDRFGLEPHWSEKKQDRMTERDWRIFGEDHNISYKGSRNRAQPMRNWEESGLIPDLMKAVHRAGYRKPSAIQMAAIPIGLQQQDMIGVAETGSGKTAAFVLPMLTYVSNLPKATPEDGPLAVVMAPTRELVMQIASETEKFAQFLNGITIRVVSIVGGQSIEEQSQKLSQGCEIVIATPGRLLDCLERRYAVLNECKYVILDEADRMIDMGLEQQVTAVLGAMPSSTEIQNPNPDPNFLSHRTTVMFSATMQPSVERIAKTYLRDPVIVTVGSRGQTTDLITQSVLMIQENEKLDKLRRLLRDIQGANQKAIVFVNRRHKVDILSRDLERSLRDERDSYRVATLHAGKAQADREATLQAFRTSAAGSQCLIATDVAGRGIDIPDVAHVVNFDMPETIEKYTHRIGRTGRAGKRGTATTFLTVNDAPVFRELADLLVRSGSSVPPQLARHCRTLP